MSKCQIVECSKEATNTELWRIGNVRAFVSVCEDDGISNKAGARTSLDYGNVTRVEGQASRSEVA